MKVTKDAVICGAKEYVETEIASRMTGMNAFAIYLVMPSLEKKVSDLYDKISTDDLLSDLFCDNGCIELDALKKRAVEALDAIGGKLHIGFLGSEIALDKEDFEKIYLCIKSK